MTNTGVIQTNHAFDHNLKEAILLALVEKEIISQRQYEQCVKLLNTNKLNSPL